MKGRNEEREEKIKIDNVQLNLTSFGHKYTTLLHIACYLRGIGGRERLPGPKRILQK